MHTPELVHHRNAQLTHDRGADLSVGQLVSALWKRKWIIVGTAAALIVLAAFWTIRATKIYTATSTIAYDPSPPKPLGTEVEEVAQSAIGMWSTREFYETQNQIIQSRAVSERVVEKLGLQHDPDFFRVPEEERSTFESRAVPDAAIVLQNRLQVEQRKGTRLVDVNIRDTDPARAQLIANTLVDAYIDKTIEDRLSATLEALEWLSRQLDQFKRELEQSELHLHEFKESNEVLSVSLEDRQNIVANEIQRLSELLTGATAQRLELEAQLEQLLAANQEDPFAVYAPSIDGNPAVSELRARHRKKLAEREALSVEYGPAHPKMKALDSELATLAQQMRDEIDGILRSAKAKVAEARATETALQQELAQANQRGMEVNLREIEYDRLQREKDNKEKLYSMLLERTTETDLTRMLRISNVQTIDRALEPVFPSSPSWPLNIAVGACAGLLLGLGLALLLTRMDSTIRTVEDAESLGLTLMGLMPAMMRPRRVAGIRLRRKDRPGAEASERDLIMHDQPRSPAAESCRTIRTNLNFMAAGSDLRTLVVSSAGPREGKTTLATNLAIAFAQNGDRVLLVDTDLRRPRVHRTFGVSNGTGVTSVVVGEHELCDAVKETDVRNLSLLPCGPIPPNPSELLDTPSFKQLIRDASEKYDRVIFDSPPLGAVTDAAIIGPRVDGVLFVLQSQLSRRAAVSSALRQLRDVGAKTVGGVLNAVDLSKNRYGYGGGYYYYSSGYYGSDGSDGPDEPGGGSGIRSSAASPGQPATAAK